MKLIRVGVINCDLHAIYYTVRMDKHDPLMLMGPDLIGNEKRRKDCWLRGGAHFYHYTRYSDRLQMTARQVKGFRIAKIWDADREIAEVACRLFYGRPTACDRIEEASDEVDMVLIADCNGDGSEHLKWATPGLKKGVPTFIDKPLAYDIKDALAIMRLAKRHRTPVLSLSILRTVPQATQFTKRFDEIGGAYFGTIKGGGASMAGHIHAISLAQHVFGNGVKSVECMGRSPLGYVHLNYGDRPDRPENGVLLNCDSGPSPHCAMYVSAYGPLGAVHSPQIGDWVFPQGVAVIIELAKKMVRTGKSPIPYEDMLENIAVATAARKAQKLGRTVKLTEVWRRT